ncbi:PREDICTED: zona pellucida sperm-binding protein 3-like [Cyprinodon variegatus]|uniref:Zona pellucida sperm-binding protein 3 n=1 Tax=Cyprinodon variegatus TaxID=28743 RepID=A0A3Q2CP49_CYPVA|nr:PREDICTED: zona pellucida sperm-binding protein 3-like [Cyprinodon variegatus]
MDRRPLQIVSWWLVFFYSLSTITEGRLGKSRGSGASHPRALLGAYGGFQPQLSAMKQQQQSEELSVQPPSVVVKCHPDFMEVVVQSDMFDKGIKVDGAHLKLGLNSPSDATECVAVQSGEEEFSLLTRFTDCGTKLSSTEEKIIYSNVLTYSPRPSPDGLLRLDDAAVPVECHFDRRYSVDGISLYPIWVPFVSIDSADDQIYFNMQIMNDDWMSERGSYVFFVGDPIYFEASIVMGHHMPLRVYVDHCVATATPDTEASPRYDFIEHNGCLVDAYLTNSKSHFLPRIEEHKLRFQLDAFRFYQEPSNQIYITCSLKAVPVTLPVNSQNRACSLVGNRWKSVDGTDQACRSCDVSQRFEEPQTTKPPKTATSTKARPIIPSTQDLFRSKAEHYTANYLNFQPGTYKRQQRNSDHKDYKSAQLGPVFVLPSRKESGSKESN